MPTEIERLIAEICSRYKKIRSGLAVGFSGSAVENALREERGGVWMSAGGKHELPFEDEQFEVVILSTDAVSRDMVREVNRVLISGGCMFFAVHETTRAEPGYTAPEIYRLVKDGFDILTIKKPKWWYFGLKGNAFTVCAKKKAWREHKRFLRDGAFLFTPFRSRT